MIKFWVWCRGWFDRCAFVALIWWFCACGLLVLYFALWVLRCVFAFGLLVGTLRWGDYLLVCADWFSWFGFWDFGLVSFMIVV